MKAENELTAKVLGEIIAEGMSISGFDIVDKVRAEAVNALGEIKSVLHDKSEEKDKLQRIDGIMKKYNMT